MNYVQNLETEKISSIALGLPYIITSRYNGFIKTIILLKLYVATYNLTKIFFKQYFLNNFVSTIWAGANVKFKVVT